MSSFKEICLLASFLALFLIISEAQVMFSTPPERADSDVRDMFESWVVKHGKKYNSAGEKEVRYQIFKDRLRWIDEGNAKNRPYKLWLNQFSDLTREEFRSCYLGGRLDKIPELPVFNRTPTIQNLELPTFVDWRTKGIIGPVRDQSPCGSCWAFGTSAAVEAVNALATGKYVELSKQQLVSCDKSNYGCQGGYPERAYEYIIKNGGLATEKNYPYKGVNGTCETWHQNAATIDGYTSVQGYNEDALKAAVAKQPVVVYIEANDHLANFHGGHFVGPCQTGLNHIVLVVGYGTENNFDYWLVKNSWGTNWGENGYVKMKRNANAPYGLCGIAMIPSYPTKTTYNLHEDDGKALSA